MAKNSTKTESGKKSQGGLNFIKEVAKYFMDFLETDFHKRRNPKRSVQLRSKSNLLIGLNLNKYPSFNALAWKMANRGFDKNVLNTIQKGAYRTNIPKNLFELIKLQSKKITAKRISKIIDQIADEVGKSSALHLKEYDQALTASLESAAKVLKTELVLPFVGNLEKPLENLNLGDENNVYLMEEELTAVLVNLLENKVSEAVRFTLAKTKVDIAKQLKEVFDIQDVKSTVLSFFENFQVGDLFAELYEMERNRTILDKQEFYLYFCDITFNNAKYPIFYIPFSVNKQGDSFGIEFDSQVYINKKALGYVTQEYNKENNHHGNLQTITERIIYLAQHQDDFRELIGEILDEIVSFFELDKKIDIPDATYQVAKSFLVRISNACYIALFDKSDEALVNDYEEILELLASEDNILASAFNKLIDDFIHMNPQPFNPEVESEWDNTKTSERLVFSSPIPLNSEQLQILSAVKKEDCKYVIVEGPPGTGKSHTITAIAFNHILKDKSVLVLSDKKEALDVVEDKITETLNKVRHDKNFQNPILRLGKTGSTYSQILAIHTIENIKNHLRAEKKHHGALESDIEKLSNTLKENLQAEILAYEDIDLKEVHEFFDLESHFENQGLPFDINEAIQNTEASGELEELRSILLSLKSKLENYNYSFDPQSKPMKSLVENLKSAISLLEKFRNDYNDYFKVEEIRDKALRLHKSKTDFPLAGEKGFSKIQKTSDELSSHSEIYKLFGLEKPKQFSNVDDLLEALSFVKNCVENLTSNFGPRLSELAIPANFSDFNYKQIQWFVEQYESLKLPILGYLFRGKKVEELNAKFRKTFKANEIGAPQKLTEKLNEVRLIIEQIIECKKDLPATMQNVDLVESITTLVKDGDLQEKFKVTFNSIKKYKSAISQIQDTKWYKEFSPKNITELEDLEIAGGAVSAFVQYKAIGNLNGQTGIDKIDDFLSKDNLSSEVASLKKYSDFLEVILNNFEDISYAISLIDKYPGIARELKITKESIKTFINNGLLEIPDLDYSKLVRYLELYHKIKKDFESVPPINYAGQKKTIEDLVTAQMTYLLDDRLIDFYENNRATARVLREIIRSKRRFPRDEFLKLKEAFPCILAGIRDYAEYIPLEPEIFDLVIIDEASQVSIAQAFPALLRAKKVLILGDKRQFSNVKSAQARTETNREYLNGLKDSFLKNVSAEQTKLVKLEKFNIKTSILEFFEFISNYNTRLLKYFRGYKEIISYSNRYFYGDLQVMKIRGKPIDEVLRFSFIKHDGKKELAQNTNSPEVNLVIAELLKLKDLDSSASVGIITPHTNQQKLFVEMISKLPAKDYFYDKLKLKIMTFDTCQGEERDIIFYSMVATEEDDRLWGVFIKDLSNVDIEEDGKIKAQRLNVGFSRARETMHFVLSKPLEKFTGSIGEALRHYYNVLEEARKEPLPNEVDVRSPMEKEVLHWLTQTSFWENNFPQNVFLKPQFKLGEYLRQLDKTYNHPPYVVDFLMVYKDEAHREHKIVIEYDGFREHFRNIDEVNEFNYSDYYSDDDVYREKVLESYGYKFLRINKFNVGEDPVAALNERVGNLVKNGVSRHSRLSRIHETIEGLQNSEMKECPKCKEVRNAEDFRDSSLITGYGRFCKYCKGQGSWRSTTRTTGYSSTRASDKICPNCHFSSVRKARLSTRNHNQYFCKKCSHIWGDGGAMIDNSKDCPQCGARMVLRNGRRGKFYGCSKFPYCRGTRQCHT